MNCYIVLHCLWNQCIANSFLVLTLILFCSTLQLCCTQAGRSYIRDKQVYAILRALDHWEKDETVQKCCLNLISILISDDPEPGMENLDHVQIPPEFSEQLDRDRESSSNGTTTTLK